MLVSLSPNPNPLPQGEGAVWRRDLEREPICNRGDAEGEYCS